MNKQKVVLFDIDYTLFDTDTYKKSELTEFQIYEEVVHVLQDTASIAIVGIFSEGETVHQHKKLIETKIRSHFDDEHLHIFTKKMDSVPSVLKKYQDAMVIFIDDKLTVLKGVKDLDQDVITIWIKRGMYAQSVPEIAGFTPDFAVDTLRDAVSYIKKL